MVLNSFLDKKLLLRAEKKTVSDKDLCIVLNAQTTCVTNVQKIISVVHQHIANFILWSFHTDMRLCYLTATNTILLKHCVAQLVQCCAVNTVYMNYITGTVEWQWKVTTKINMTSILIRKCKVWFYPKQDLNVYKKLHEMKITPIQRKIQKFWRHYPSQRTF